MLAGHLVMTILLPWLLLVPTAEEGTDFERPRVPTSDPSTIVSITFTGTDKTQVEAARLLARHGVGGTFYVNSGLLDYPGYLSTEQLRAISRSRQEVGGASVGGEDLGNMPEAKARRQVCDDRATLAQLGFQVTSFAYPHGAASEQAKAAAQSCGYNSGRDLSGLYESPLSCSSCPAGETLPPTDDFRIRTIPQTRSLTSLASAVRRTQESGGGWVVLSMERVCVCPAGTSAEIDPAVLDAFLSWMADQRENVEVKTVDQVMGGALQPARGTPLRRLVPDPSAAISDAEPLSTAAAWTVFGVGIGQAQVIFLGLVVTFTVVLTHRMGTKGQRHEHRA